MAQNLLELVQNYFRGETVQQASSALGESESSVGTALRSIVPLVLGGLFARSQQSGGTAELFGLAQQAHSSGIISNMGSLLGGLSSNSNTAPAADGSLLNKATELLRGVFGTQFAPAVETVSQQAGVRTSTVSSLMSMAAPVALSLLGRHAADNGLDSNGFGNYLTSQRSSIMVALGSLPGGLGSMLSGLGLRAAAHNVAADVRGSTPQMAATATPTRWPWLLLLVLGLSALFFVMRSCNKSPEPSMPMGTLPIDTTTTTMPATDTTAVGPPAAPTGRYDEASGNYIYDTGTMTTIKLADGTVLSVGNNSMEARLFNFLNDPAQTVSDDKTQGWMSLDRVYFNTGKSTLTTESQAQLKNLAAILKAFPNAAVKLGGYTDNKGAAATNMALSANRAKGARQAVVTDGIDESRITAEGYGSAHPLATNDTPEGRAQNRRVDLRATKK